MTECLLAYLDPLDSCATSARPEAPVCSLWQHKLPVGCCLLLYRDEWKAAIEAAAAAASRQVEEVKQKMAAEAAAAPGRDKALLQQAQDAAAVLVKQQVRAMLTCCMQWALYTLHTPLGACTGS